MFDIIGDIHGHADELEALLQKMGYTNSKGYYSHPSRKALFVGDYIDRGPKIPKVLSIVKSMVDTGAAIALMGNHEYNALCFHHYRKNGEPLRSHSPKNMTQHEQTIKQFKGREEEWQGYLDWFFTLPLWYENEYFRAVHATWDVDALHDLSTALVDERLTKDLLEPSLDKATPFYAAIENVLKGKEISMPLGQTFKDKDGHTRDAMRIKWWLPIKEHTYKSLSILDLPQLPEEVPPNEHHGFKHYPAHEKPVFFGHYWLQGDPSLYRSNICCLDYSVAKGGQLVGYRFEGEAELRDDQFIY